MKELAESLDRQDAEKGKLFGGLVPRKWFAVMAPVAAAALSYVWIVKMR